MNEIIINSLIAAGFVSLLSLAGVLSFAIKKNALSKISLFLVAFSTGALLGGAFLHILPEVVEENSSLDIFVYVLVGILVFYVLEKFLKWHHCHSGNECPDHTFTYMSLIADGLHNFIDGLIIVSAFYVSPEVGIATTIAIALHEIPQEISDFGVLIHGGFSRTRALVWNFTSASLAILGVTVGSVLINLVEGISIVLLPLAAGGLIYISMSDLIPELHKETGLKRSLISFSFFLMGLVFMYLSKVIFE